MDKNNFQSPAEGEKISNPPIKGGSPELATSDVITNSFPVLLDTPSLQAIRRDLPKVDRKMTRLSSDLTDCVVYWRKVFDTYLSTSDASLPQQDSAISLMNIDVLKGVGSLKGTFASLKAIDNQLRLAKRERLAVGGVEVPCSVYLLTMALSTFALGVATSPTNINNFVGAVTELVKSVTTELCTLDYIDADEGVEVRDVVDVCLAQMASLGEGIMANNRTGTLEDAKGLHEFVQFCSAIKAML